MKIPQKKTRVDQSESHHTKDTPRKSGKDFNKDDKGVKIKKTSDSPQSKKSKNPPKNRSEMTMIFDQLLEHFKNNLFEAQNANNPSAHLEELEKKSTKHMNIFSHNWSQPLI